MDEPRTIEPLDELGQRDLRFDARERRAEAVVNPAAESEVGAVFTVRIEPIGIAEARGGAVSCGGGQA